MGSCLLMRLCNPRPDYITTVELSTLAQTYLSLLPQTPGIALMLQPRVLRAVSPSFAVHAVLYALHLAPPLFLLQSLLLPFLGPSRPLRHCSVRMSAMARHHPVSIHVTTITTTTRIHVRSPNLTHATTPPARAELMNWPLTPSRWNTSMRGLKRHMTALFAFVAHATALARRVSWATALRPEFSTTLSGRHLLGQDQQQMTLALLTRQTLCRL